MSTNTSKLRAVFPFVILICIALGFFYKTLLFGKYPFPGDLLLTQYGPWRHQSYDGYVAGAIPTKNQYFDVLRELYPWKTVAIDQMKKGSIPFWNPYNFSGAPLLANYQSQIFYPFGIVYYLFPQIKAWTIMVILQPILGTMFMYMFATEIGLSAVAAMLAAVLFNFSSFASVWMEFTTVWHTILWLPLLLYIIEKSIKAGSMSLLQKIVFIGSLCSSITGGHPQDFLNTFLFLCIYTVVRIIGEPKWSVKEKKQFFFKNIVTLFPIPFLLTLPQLLPTVELFGSSARVTHDYANILENMLIQWWQLPLLPIADFFGNPATESSITGDYVGKTLSIGVAGFVLVAAALFEKGKNWHKKIFTYTAIVILLLTVRSPVSELFYRFPIPVLSTGTPTRVLFVLAFALSILAGMGYDYLNFRKKENRTSTILIVVWGIFLLLWGIVSVHPFMSVTPVAISVMKRSLLFASALLFAATSIALIGQKGRWIYVLFLPLCTIELAYGFLKFNPFVPRTFIYPKNDLITFIQSKGASDRVWGYGTAEMEANFATQEKIFSTDGTDPLNLRWYNQFIQSSSKGEIPSTFNRTTRSDAKIASGYGEKDLPKNIFRLKVMDTLAVRYVIDRVDNPKDDTTFDTSRFKPIWQKDSWTVFENMNASARTFTTGDVQFYNSDKEFESKFFAESFIPGKSVLVENAYRKDFDIITPATGTAQIISYQPSSVSIQTKTETTQVVFLSDTYDPNWTASIDGKNAKVYKMTYAFKGVIVPPGEHTVTFKYISKAFIRGVYISGFTLFFCIGIGIVSMLRFTVSRHGKKN